MSERATLIETLDAWAHDDRLRRDVATAVLAAANASRDISQALRLGALSGVSHACAGRQPAIDPHHELVTFAGDTFVAALAGGPVALVVSAVHDTPIDIAPQGPLVVAVAPLDGASNFGTNAAIGSIFSVLPNVTHPAGLLPGTEQLAAGFVVYGPQTLLALTLGAGTRVFTLDPRTGSYVLTAPHSHVPAEAAEFAINASNHWHWDEPIRTYVDDCLRGKDGPRAAEYNMRWTGSFVAEIYRIMVRGGVYLYPGDRRKGCAGGRLKLVTEANPIAFIVEQAGGRASTGSQRVLDLRPAGWHQPTPLFAGSRAEVAYLERLTNDPHAITERSPLFGRRGLFRV